MLLRATAVEATNVVAVAVTVGVAAVVGAVVDVVVVLDHDDNCSANIGAAVLGGDRPVLLSGERPRHLRPGIIKGADFLVALRPW